MAQPSANQRLYLRVEGFDGDRLILRKFMPIGKLTEKGIITLLQRLACKGLDYSDIIAGSLPKNACGHHSVFDPQIGQGGKQLTVTVGYGRHYTASKCRTDELPNNWHVDLIEDD